jgi:hypothetical protein
MFATTEGATARITIRKRAWPSRGIAEELDIIELRSMFGACQIARRVAETWGCRYIVNRRLNARGWTLWGTPNRRMRIEVRPLC